MISYSLEMKNTNILARIYRLIGEGGDGGVGISGN